jgi:hypothetical protein
MQKYCKTSDKLNWTAVPQSKHKMEISLSNS